MNAPDRTNGLPTDRLEDLLADQALFGLSDAEQRELDALLSESDIAADEFEQVAANVVLAENQIPTGQMPAALRDRIMAASASEATVTLPKTVAAPQTQQWGGWLLLAASILFAAFILRPADPTPTVEVSPAELQAELLAAQKQANSQVVRVSWTRGADETAKGAEGEVLWNPKTQQGVMRFRGLAKNDPKKEQYQLWIFDAERNEAHPVDGGVFDIADADVDTLIPIDARLPINEATLFAITVEQPGGVVVSTRERLPLLAPVEAVN